MVDVAVPGSYISCSRCILTDRVAVMTKRLMCAAYCAAVVDKSQARGPRMRQGCARSGVVTTGQATPMPYGRCHPLCLCEVSRRIRRRRARNG